MKKKYTVKVYEFFESETHSRETLIATEDTYAKSEQQAINNVKFRLAGKTSQYKPMAVSGHWANGLRYKIERI
jgi:hypothetical protein